MIVIARSFSSLTDKIKKPQRVLSPAAGHAFKIKWGDVSHTVAPGHRSDRMFTGR